jgi:hypothetical protein
MQDDHTMSLSTGRIVSRHRILLLAFLFVVRIPEKRNHTRCFPDLCSEHARSLFRFGTEHEPFQEDREKGRGLATNGNHV